MAENEVAMFVDFENIATSAEEVFGQAELDPIMRIAQEYGRCTVKRAYGNWGRYASYRQQLTDHAFDLIQLFSFGGRGKNAADIQMAVDAMETAFVRPQLGVFVLVTGDGDFSAVARKLRSYGKVVVGIGLRKSTSEVLVKACDRFVIYDNLISVDSGAPGEKPLQPEARASTYSVELGRQLLQQAMGRLLANSGAREVHATSLKQEMLRLDPTFNELPMGYEKFRDFLEAQADLVHTFHRDDRGTMLMVQPQDHATVRDAAQDPGFQYREAINAAGLPLPDPDARVDILGQLYDLLSAQPNRYSLDLAAAQLKATYDANNVLRTRDEVNDTAGLLRFANVLDHVPESWELDPLTIQPDLSRQEFVDRCEAVYIAMLLEQNLAIDSEAVARLLFGAVGQKWRVEELTRLAQQRLGRPVVETGSVDGWEMPARLAENADLADVVRDLRECQLATEPSVDRARELNAEGMRIRTTDFESARQFFLEAARMTYELLKEGRPRASFIDLEWQLASYCASTAGASFFRRSYQEAFRYYLAFFVLAKETEPVWDKVRGLSQPMLSFFFSLAATAHGEAFPVSVGKTHPARIAIMAYNHANPEVTEGWVQIATELARVNPGVLRSVLQRLEALDKNGEEEGVERTRLALSSIVQRPAQATPEGDEPSPDQAAA